MEEQTTEGGRLIMFSELVNGIIEPSFHSHSLCAHIVVITFYDIPVAHLFYNSEIVTTDDDDDDVR